MKRQTHTRFNVDRFSFDVTRFVYVLYLYLFVYLYISPQRYPL